MRRSHEGRDFIAGQSVTTLNDRARHQLRRVGQGVKNRSMRARWGLGILLGLSVLWSQTRPPALDAIPTDADRGAAGITRSLHALRTRASMLMVTAHPD